MLVFLTLILPTLIWFHIVSSCFAVDIVVDDGDTLALNCSSFAAAVKEEVVDHDADVGKMILQTMAFFVPKEAGEACILEEALECI